jgi:hypothetical protein
MNNISSCMCGSYDDVKKYHANGGELHYWCLKCNNRVYPDDSTLRLLNGQVTRILDSRRILYDK